MYKGRPALIDIRARLNVLDQTGTDVNVIVPVPWIEAFRKIYSDPVLATQAARLMNDELAAVVASHPTRFRGVAILPVVDPDAMVAELHRAVKELGFVGAYVAVGPTAKRMDHPDYEHLYKALVDLDATLWLHPSRPPIIPDYTDEKLSQYYEWLLVGWPYDTTSAMFRIVFAGVFDRYPTIRIVTHHHGAFVPLLEARLANGWPLLEPVGLPMPTKISKPYVDHFRSFTATRHRPDLRQRHSNWQWISLAPRGSCTDLTRRLTSRTVAFSSRERYARSRRWAPRRKQKPQYSQRMRSVF